ncbi:FkbM family methyltransferase [Neorhizobium galegae]|uniref:FkbM family methyltransferase n=1 Tax=Neorhizobium galegae TaxID=399 RepID=UPI0021012C83|nr:FkbM family methyltransferase [Neorhizobium galegae]MCQ1571709.1 FkbM family methyltransferase [Neorhizobium galegae]
MMGLKRFRPKRQPELRKYVIGGVEILLTPDHQLPKYQSKHALYDRFLPILASILPDDGSWIIDVGANVGDTAVALAQNCKNPILSVEGDPEFYSLLQQNIQHLERRVTPVQALVGTGRIAGNLVQDGTTARRKESGNAPTISLDEVIKTHALGTVSLLKTDTDGYDADIIRSAPGMLEASRPLIFWENEFQSKDQLDELESGYGFLSSLGYEKIWIFDNFGFPILIGVGFDALRQLNSYVHAMMVMKAPQTIFYTDVLAATPENEHLAIEAISKYRGLLGDTYGREG